MIAKRKPEFGKKIKIMKMQEGRNWPCLSCHTNSADVNRQQRDVVIREGPSSISHNGKCLSC